MDETFEQRKRDHFFLSLEEKSESLERAGFDRVQLVHQALPELDFDEVSLAQEVLGQSMKTPFFASSMTGGWKGSEEFNLILAKACERRSWVMGVGSQRGQLFEPEKEKEWKKIRKACPQLVLLGNIGLAQAISSCTSDLKRLLDSIEGVGMIVHLNPLQEALQKEGTPQFAGGLKAIERIARELPVPVIVKETGCGFSKETLNLLTGLNLGAVDLSGKGGTHWGRIEGTRFSKSDFRFGMGETFSNWGVSTMESLLHSREEKRDYEVWVSGGLRTGLDGAKALALGAKAVGLGRPLLQAFHHGEEALDQTMARLEYELKVSLFCTGSVGLEELKQEEKWMILS